MIYGQMKRDEYKDKASETTHQAQVETSSYEWSYSLVANIRSDIIMKWVVVYEINEWQMKKEEYKEGASEAAGQAQVRRSYVRM